MIAIDLSKQQALDADPKAIQQINFTANLGRAGNTRIYFILEEANETVFEFSQGKLGNLLSGKWAIATSQGRVINKKGNGINIAGEGVIRAAYDNKKTFNIAPSFNKLWNTRVLSK